MPTLVDVDETSSMTSGATHQAWVQEQQASLLLGAASRPTNDDGFGYWDETGVGAGREEQNIGRSVAVRNPKSDPKPVLNQKQPVPTTNNNLLPSVIQVRRETDTSSLQCVSNKKLVKAEEKPSYRPFQKAPSKTTTASTISKAHRKVPRHNKLANKQAKPRDTSRSQMSRPTPRKQGRAEGRNGAHFVDSQGGGNNNKTGTAAPWHTKRGTHPGALRTSRNSGTVRVCVPPQKDPSTGLFRPPPILPPGHVWDGTVGKLVPVKDEEGAVVDTKKNVKRASKDDRDDDNASVETSYTVDILYPDDSTKALSTPRRYKSDWSSIRTPANSGSKRKMLIDFSAEAEWDWTPEKLPLSNVTVSSKASDTHVSTKASNKKAKLAPGIATMAKEAPTKKFLRRAMAENRLQPDGSVIPTKTPRKDKGLFMSPRGKAPSGFDWDGHRGVWSPRKSANKTVEKPTAVSKPAVRPPGIDKPRTLDKPTVDKPSIDKPSAVCKPIVDKLGSPCKPSVEKPVTSVTQPGTNKKPDKIAASPCGDCPHCRRLEDCGRCLWCLQSRDCCLRVCVTPLVASTPVKVDP